MPFSAMMRVRRLALLATVACLTPGKDTKVGNITFTGTIQTKHRLVGVGVRTMSFLRFPLYTLGLYCDQVGSYEGLRESILSCSMDWCMRIVPIRNVNLNHLRGAYGRRIPTGVEGREEFLASLPNTTLSMERSYLLIEWTAGELWINVNDQIKTGPIKSLALAQAIMDIYLGEEAAIPSLLSDLADSVGEK